MKKYQLVLLIICIVTLPLGSAIIGVWGHNAYRNRADSNLYYSDEKTFSLKELENIKIEVGNADVRIVPGTGDDVKVTLSGYEPNAGGRLESAMNGGTLDIKQPSRLRFFNFNIGLLWGARYVNLVEIEIDPHYMGNLDISSASGRVESDYLYARRVSVSTMSGDVRLGNLTCFDFDCSTMSGNVNVNSLSSDRYNISTMSGDVNISGLTPGRLDCSTASGRIRVEYKAFGNDISFSTMSGDIDLRLPPDARFSLEKSTMSGDMDNELGTDSSSQYRIYMSTMSGDMRIRKR